MKKSKLMSTALSMLLVGSIILNAGIIEGNAEEAVHSNDATSSTSISEKKVDNESTKKNKLMDDSNITESIILSFFNDSIDNTKEKSTELCSSVLDKVMPKPVKVINPKIEFTALTEIKITWEPDSKREYEVSYDTDAEYSENITFVYPEAGLCYLTGLRIDSEYEITITPVIKEKENLYPVKYTKTVHTSNPEVIQNFDHIDGWTNCFAGEKASGLTAMPSSGAIYGSTCDAVTGTGIRRHANGDYACAMGTHFGYCNDRFLIELDNGIQFTTRICDSKGEGDVQDEFGYGLWHNFGGSGKCIIEFIWDDGNIPGCVSFSGSWGGYNWNGLNLGANIKSIKKLANYDV